MHEKIKKQVREAMKFREELKLSVLRSMLTAFTNELVATKRKPQEELPDEEVVQVIRRLAKQRKESIEQFTKGNRPELAEKEEKELEILNEYLPKMMSEEEIRKVALKKKEEIGDLNMGMLIGAVMKELKGKADGGDVKKVVEEII